MKFESVWSSVGRWLKHNRSREWEQSLELVQKAVARAAAISLLEMKADIIYIPEGREDLIEDREGSANAALVEKRGNFRIYDIGGSMAKLKAELEGPHDLQPDLEGVKAEFQGQHDLQADLAGGIKIRCCNSLFADKVFWDDWQTITH